MNLMHLKYAVEIAETNSMTKAAERLYTAQPNLSRAIRELENTLGIQIFKRTSKGLYPTAQGEVFLARARKILAQVDELEDMFRDGKKKESEFSISVPRASYIAEAFLEFVRKLPRDLAVEIYYKETNAMRAISNILNADYRMGILRYQSVYDRNFKEMLDEKELEGELVCEFVPVLIFSSKSPLAEKEEIEPKDLKDLIELSHPDPYVPSISPATARKNEVLSESTRHVFIFERGSQFDLLATHPETFMWVSPVPERLLKLHGLVMRECSFISKRYRDVLIRKRDYKLTELDKRFIDELMRAKREIIK
ncbi:MAG TPA: LysR family transcriptional regulator [Bacillota bacterium]|nr:LysR family transcriptional regulator [Clostridiales bacterium]HPT85321.1 LysR family transcriptional regulator [Bacillota bacterium]